jgi:mono/diheme cytochrome c family protein
MLRWLTVGVALAACESAPRSLPELPAATPPSHSQEQLAAASALHVAVTEGRLADLRDLARVVGGVPELLDPAHRIAGAADLAAAGAALGPLAGACVDCHAAAGTSIARGSARAEAAPTAQHTLVAQMARDQWAVARLWEGATGPRDDAWSEGAVVLAITPRDIQTVMHGKPNVEAFELAERMREQAGRAVTLKEPGARAALYGDLVATCASCHRIMRPEPVVRARSEPVARFP